MSIIQRIRDKAAWVLFIAIGVALLGFLVQDAFVGKSGRGLFAGNATTVGVVNGKKLEAVDYEKKIKQAEDQYQSMGYPMNDMMRQNVREQAWNQFISETTIEEEVDKLGISVSSKELDDMLFGANAPEDFRKQFTNEQGGYDVNAAKNAIAQLRKQKNNTMADNFNNVYLPALVSNRLHEKFLSLLGNTTYFPRWMLEKLNSDNSSMAAVSYVHVPYTSITDSTIKVSDDDIATYINKHKEEFKQEESRGIAYVSFDASPSPTDTADLRNKLAALKKEFAAAPDADINAFLVRNGTQSNFLDGYISKSAIQVPSKDSIMALPKGGVFGPYPDGNSFTIAKKIDEKTMPDSVRVRHILVATADPRTGQPILEDSIGKRRIDSIKVAIESGSRFDSLAKKLSDDRNSPDGGSAALGGDLGYFAANKMVKEFNDFCFEGKKGDRKIVKTQFGYHYIEITDQKNFNSAYKIAYLAKPIIASQETDDKASGLASQFASESRNAKAFDENVKKKNYNKLLASDIKPNDMNVPALGSSRQLVKWVYEASTGDVSEMFTIDSKYAVVMLTEINKEGTMSPAKARPLVEFIIRNQKKADQIKKKIGTSATLETLATSTNQQVSKTDSLSFARPFFINAGQEGKVGGYVFNPGAKGKISAPVAGNGGVYVLRTENVYAKQNEAGNVEQQRMALTQNQKSAAGRGVVEASLKKAATIKDNRSKIF
jgi:peptidyl-prolyl cis-trans isomerase D